MLRVVDIPNQAAGISYASFDWRIGEPVTCVVPEGTTGLL